MPLPKAVREEVEPIITEYCAKRVPEHAWRQVKMGFDVRGDAITLFEERPHWQNPDHWIKSPIAKFRYDQKIRKWSLFCADRNSRWHNYQAKPTTNIQVLLREVDSDPTGIFWG
ncbi:MAG TPA: DUF3024 domain-containing protein [Bacteroidota bacterium]